MNEVCINHTRRLLPSSWNELSAKQLLMVSSLFVKKTTLTTFKVHLLFKFLNIRYRLWMKMSPVDVHGLGESLNFLLEKVSLTKALIGSFHLRRFPWRQYIGPGDGMQTSTLGEFTKAHVRYQAYDKSRDPAMLDELVAVLFRPKKPLWFIRRHWLESTDSRVKLMDRTIARRAARFSKLPLELKYAVFLFFAGVYGSLGERFPNVFRDKAGSSGEKHTGWATLIISLADGKTDDQSLERIMNSNLYNVMLGLEQKSIEYFEFIKKYPQND